MRVLVACERSGRVRDALLARGHDAISCDIEPTDAPGPHITGRVEDFLGDGWDMVIAFPPCTYLSRAGQPCFTRCLHPGHDDAYRRSRHLLAIEAALLIHALLGAAPRVAVENPLPASFPATLLPRWTAMSEPFRFGDPWRKRTCWWLRGLAPLTPTSVVHPKFRWITTGGRHYYDPRAPGRHSFERSLTPLGLAEAIAEQWGRPDPQTLF